MHPQHPPAFASLSVPAVAFGVPVVAGARALLADRASARRAARRFLFRDASSSAGGANGRIERCTIVEGIGSVCGDVGIDTGADGEVGRERPGEEEEGKLAYGRRGCFLRNMC